LQPPLSYPYTCTQVSIYTPSSFFFIDPPTTEIYTLSLHERSSDLLTFLLSVPIEVSEARRLARQQAMLLDLPPRGQKPEGRATPDRKSTRLNSSHVAISYAVFCLKKKKKT